MSLYRPPITVLGATQYEHQPLASLSVTPTENTWYTILNTTTNVLLEWVRVHQANDQTAAKSLAVRFTIDGQTYVSSYTSCAHDTRYWCMLGANGVVYLKTADVNPAFYMGLRGKSVKVEVQFADTPGTNQVLVGFATYARLKATTL